ncbi:ecdysteroid 22-kinase family protein [Nocardia cerradoensis]|uniref:ecdysteroid 22-kinase family protein n=1 Tax=Nocardia cerradoensis TaxID=85688 RepID=UPI001FD12A33|nr:ecdysteroid 22-kinase family protein [Nocardia cerradoensis]
MTAMAEVLVDAERITPQWLSRALSTPVRAVTATPVGTGQMGSVFRLEIDGESAPARLMAKLPAADPAARAMVAGAYRQEIRFYREIAPTVSVRVPTCHFAEFAGDGAEFTLLLDDLAPARQGDQIAGCTVAQANAAVRNLAALHGPRWCDPGLSAIDGLNFNGAAEAQALSELYGPATEVFLERLGQRLSPADRDTLRACVPGIADWLLAAPDRFAPVHGDYRLDNLMFSDDSGEVEVWALDWQTLGLGLPARDLSYFVATGLEPDLRRAHEDSIIETYWRALCSHGVGDYTLDQCRRDYGFALVQGPLVAVFGAAYGTVTPRGDEMFAAMARRSCAAIRDWDALGRTPA